MKTVQLKVKRQDAPGAAPRWEEFEVPWEERLRYQIHMPLPESGLCVVLPSLVWDEAPPANGPDASASRAAQAISASVVVRRRARMKFEATQAKTRLRKERCVGLC